MARPALCAAVCALILSVLTLAMPALLFTEGPYDVLVPLDAGIRFTEGIFPSLDYPSPIGALYAALHGLAMTAGGVDARAIIWANLLVLMLCLVLSAQILRGAAGLTQFSILLLLSATLLLPLDVDVLPPDYRYVANYNAWGWGFLTPVLVWALWRCAAGWIGNAAVGLALTCLFYTKLSFFGGAILLMPLGLLLGRPWRDYVLPTIIVLIAIGVGAALGLVGPYLADNLDLLRIADAVRVYKLCWQMVSLFNAPVTVAMVVICYQSGWRHRVTGVLFLAWFILHLTALQNNYKIIPLVGMPLMLLLPRLPIKARRWPGVVTTAQAVALALVCALGIAGQPLIAQSTAAMALGPAGSLGARILLSSRLGTGGWTPAAPGDRYPDTDTLAHQDMVAAQELLGDRRGRVLALEFSNFLLASWPAARPAIGALLWYDLGRSYSREMAVSGTEAFRGLDWILWPKRYRSDNVRQLALLYQPWLESCATLVKENDLWRLYAPRQSAVAACRP